MPGSISPEDGARPECQLDVAERPAFDRDLALALGAPWLANDANCFALSEALDGAGAGARSVFGVILGTGCGGGIADRRLTGRRGAPLEDGAQLAPLARVYRAAWGLCWCGDRGCSFEHVCVLSIAPRDLVPHSPAMTNSVG